MAMVKQAQGRFAVVGLISAALLLVGVAAGCNAVAGMWWVVKDGKTAPAEYKGLNGKKVAVVVRGPSTGMFRQQQNIPFKMAKGINMLLMQNLSKKTTLIPAEKVDTITDKEELTDFVEIGKQLDAEQVVAVDLEEYNTKLSSTIYSGTATITITVFDMKKDGEEIYTKTLRNIEFPPTSGGQPAGTMKSQQFVDLFIRHLCEHVSRNFYDFDPRTDFAGWGLAD
jgi:hypothetical protein